MITENQERLLAELRMNISSEKCISIGTGIDINISINGKRLAHTYSVEREIAALSSIYAPNEEYRLRVSALLHDITKQLSIDKQLQLCDEFGIIYTQYDKLMPKTFHARTAAEVIKRFYPDFADEFILTAVSHHTTGRADMNIGEKLLYLADYIEDTRVFDDCVKLRSYFYTRLDGAIDANERLSVLGDTLILSFDMSIRGLIDDGIPIHRDTFEARNFLIEEKELEK